MPSTDLLEAMGRFNEELAAAGVLTAGEGLKPSVAGLRVGFNGEDRSVTEGPFDLGPGLVAGFWIWEVRDMAEALAWARRCPPPMPDGGELELRPVYDLADFGDAVSPELAEQEARLRAVTL